MDYESLIADLQKISQMNSISHYKRDVCAAAAIALSTLQAENEELKEKLYDGEGVNLVDYWMQQAKIEENGHRNCQAENEKLRAELERMTVERDNAKSPKVLEAVDELMKFARTRMCTVDWLYYVDVLGKWRGQKKN